MTAEQKINTNFINFVKPSTGIASALVRDITVKRYAVELSRNPANSQALSLIRIAERLLQKCGVNGQIFHDTDERLVLILSSENQATHFARVATRLPGISAQAARALLCLNLESAELARNTRRLAEEALATLANNAALFLPDLDKQVRLILPDKQAIPSLVKLHEKFFPACA